MSTEVNEAAVEEVNGALARNFASFASQQWIDIASAQTKTGANQAAAQLSLGETVEWMTPGIVHRNGKVWPAAILLVTPHRLIVSASRGSIRTKREVSSLYRGPESLIGVSQRVLPGTSTDHWMLEIATQQGPFLFAIPNFEDSDSLAQITAAFLARRAQFTPEFGTLVDGVPWGAPAPAPPTTAPEADPFEAAKADLAAAPADGGPATEVFSWQEPESTDIPSEPVTQQFWSPTEASAPIYTPPVVATFAKPEPEPEPEPEPAAALPAPDWYPDPLGEAGLRYWDGQAWTQHTAN